MTCLIIDFFHSISLKVTSENSNTLKSLCWRTYISFAIFIICLFIYSYKESLISRGTTFQYQHHWWTQSLILFCLLRDLTTIKGWNFPGDWNSLSNSYAHLCKKSFSLLTSKGIWHVESGRKFKEVCRGPVTRRGSQNTADIDSGEQCQWEAELFGEQKCARRQIRKESGGGFLWWDQFQLKIKGFPTPGPEGEKIHS